MAQVKASALRDKTLAELQEQETNLREQIFKLRFQKSLGTAENPQKIVVVRKELARVLTVLREKSEAGH